MVDAVQHLDAELGELDRDALTRSMAAVVACDPWRAAQLADMESAHGWRSAAEFASSCAQAANLRLNPWEVPPAQLPPDGPGRRLVERMLAAGVSQFEPDPLAALAQAERPPRKSRR
jgi:hypothetical protein